jgi:hypothetical protein
MLQAGRSGFGLRMTSLDLKSDFILQLLKVIMPLLITALSYHLIVPYELTGV